MHPVDLLRAVPGARGFWGKGERWVAHAGVLAALEGEPGRGRFREIADQARTLVGEPGPIWPESADRRTAGRPRFYGGFSFQDEPGAARLWVGFPAALFHLPAVELEGDAGGVARLRVRAAWSEGDDPAVVRARLEGRLRELSARLASRLDREGAGPSDPFAPAARGAGALPSPLEQRPGDRAAWDASVERILRAIGAAEVRKVVLARTLDVQPARALDPLRVLDHLWAANRTAHVFYFEPRPERAFLGAAPETIATLRRGVFHATAVAGSTGLGATPEEQGSLAADLMASGKDRAEHRISLEDMLGRLGRLATDVRAEQEPHVLAVAALQHLETEIRARVREGTTVLDLLGELHPTPAVCGDPREAALERLAAEEPFERGWYGGPVGWFDLDGNGMFAPGLRCGVVAEGAWRLFAGAGIVAGSRPDAEWAETGIKLEPMLRALGRAAGSGS